MKVILEGDPKEIAALVVELQERHENVVSAADTSEAIIQRLQEKPDRVRQAFSL